MKNSILRLLLYTLILSGFIILSKIYIQNGYLKNVYNIKYFVVTTIVSGLLLLITLLLLKKEKIKLIKYNQKLKLLTLIIVIILLFCVKNINSASLEFKSKIDILKLTFYSTKYLFVGLFEEFYFRLLVFTLLCNYFKENLFKISVLTSLLFALVHISNVFLDTFNYQDVLFQIMSAFGLGLLLQIIFINTKNIYLVSIIHFYLDFSGAIEYQFFFKIKDIDAIQSNENLTFIVFFTLIVISLIFAFYNLRRKKTTYFLTSI